MLVLKSQMDLGGRVLSVFLSLHQSHFGIGLTGTVNILSWEEVYCIVTIVGGYGWKFETQLGTI